MQCIGWLCLLGLLVQIVLSLLYDLGGDCHLLSTYACLLEVELDSLVVSGAVGGGEYD